MELKDNENDPNCLLIFNWAKDSLKSQIQNGTTPVWAYDDSSHPTLSGQLTAFHIEPFGAGNHYGFRRGSWGLYGTMDFMHEAAHHMGYTHTTSFTAYNAEECIKL